MTGADRPIERTATDPDAAAGRPCRRCGSDAGRIHAVLHHFQCAYVGPKYDFKSDESGVSQCPKCRTLMKMNHEDWEIVGRSYRCVACGYEDV